VRLSEQQRQQIVKVLRHTLGDDAAVYLFGSRCDDRKRGGDIDLFVEVDDSDDWWQRRLQADVALQRCLGERKIDLIVHRRGQPYQPIAHIALATGIQLEEQMTEQSQHTYFVSRHAGAVTWAKRQGITVDALVPHFDQQTMEQLQAGDTVIGTLPVHLAAQVCQRGAHYVHLSLQLPAELRGKELTAEDMERCQARLEGFRVVPDNY